MMPAVLKALRYKVMAVVLLTTITAVVVISTALVFYELRSYRQSWLSDIATQTELIASSTAAALQFDDAETANEALAVLSLRPRIRAAAVYDASGTQFAIYRRKSTVSEIPLLPDIDGTTVEQNRMISFKRIVANNEILGTAYVQADYPAAERLRDYLQIVVEATVLALLIAAGVSFWLQSVITRPILSIAAVARDVVAKGNFSLRASKITNDEVGDLVDDFNAMLVGIENRATAQELSNRELAHEISERLEAEKRINELNAMLEARVLERTAQLEVTNQELEAFCYSVSHDLRSPLRAIDGFSQALEEELPEEISPDAQHYFNRIRSATHRMGQLIEDLLNLSRVSRGTLESQPVNLSDIANEVVTSLVAANPGRKIEVSIWHTMSGNGDARLLRIVLENLLGNAWKFTSKAEQARIEMGTMRDVDRTVFYIRDNGAGFDMTYADKLFGTFQRLHGTNEFPGTGIGLATVQRIVHRHGGRIWADAAPEKGAAFFFTLAPDIPPNAYQS